LVIRLWGEGATRNWKTSVKDNRVAARVCDWGGSGGRTAEEGSPLGGYNSKGDSRPGREERAGTRKM